MSAVRLGLFFADSVNDNTYNPPFLLTNIEINTSIICGEYTISPLIPSHSMNEIDWKWTLTLTTSMPTFSRPYINVLIRKVRTIA